MLIVDANNVLHAAGDARAPDAIVRLLDAILRSRYAAREVVLVCDGSPGRLIPGAQASLVRLLAGQSGSRVVYAGPEREADDVIEAMVAAAAAPARVTVVSSDARLALAAFRAGAASLRADEFLGHLEKDRVKAAAREIAADDALDTASVGWWMNYFGLDGQPRPHPRPPRSAPKTQPPETPPTPRRQKKDPGPALPPDDWLSEARRMWPGVTEGELDMERVLKSHSPPKKRKKRKG